MTAFALSVILFVNTAASQVSTWPATLAVRLLIHVLRQPTFFFSSLLSAVSVDLPRSCLVKNVCPSRRVKYSVQIEMPFQVLKENYLMSCNYLFNKFSIYI